MYDVKVSDDEIVNDQMIHNPWRNAYWFARMFINGDKYGAVGKEYKLLTNICMALRTILSDESQPDEIKLILSKEIIIELFQKRFSRKTSKTERVDLFLLDLFEKLKTIKDVEVLILTANSILIPINMALERIPSNDKEFTESIAKAYLDKLGENALATVITLWDDAGVMGCLTAERIEVVRGFTHLRRDIAQMPELEANMILTAYVQEFERRLGQKRKGRAGGSLEDVVSYLFKYFNIKAEHGPEHFQSDIEVDKWVRCKDRWLIGISCKRTLRERWKQVSSASTEVLSNYKIKEIWHLITYDEDLSDDKLTLLGGQRHVFYLRDDSRRYQYAKSHLGMKSYVRPMSDFIKDLKKQQEN